MWDNLFKECETKSTLFYSLATNKKNGEETEKLLGKVINENLWKYNFHRLQHKKICLRFNEVFNWIMTACKTKLIILNDWD